MYCIRVVVFMGDRFDLVTLSVCQESHEDVADRKLTTSLSCSQDILLYSNIFSVTMMFGSRSTRLRWRLLDEIGRQQKVVLRAQVLEGGRVGHRWVIPSVVRHLQCLNRQILSRSISYPWS